MDGDVPWRPVSVIWVTLTVVVVVVDSKRETTSVRFLSPSPGMQLGRIYDDVTNQ